MPLPVPPPPTGEAGAFAASCWRHSVLAEVRIGYRRCLYAYRHAACLSQQLAHTPPDGERRDSFSRGAADTAFGDDIFVDRPIADITGLWGVFDYRLWLMSAMITFAAAAARR